MPQRIISLEDAFNTSAPKAPTTTPNVLSLEDAFGVGNGETAPPAPPPTGATGSWGPSLSFIKDLTVGVDPVTLYHRTVEPIADFINRIQPGGSTRSTTRPAPPPMSPEGEIGSKVMTLGALADPLPQISRVVLNALTDADKMMLKAAALKQFKQAGQGNVPNGPAGWTAWALSKITAPQTRAKVLESISKFMTEENTSRITAPETPAFRGTPAPTPPTPVTKAVGRDAVKTVGMGKVPAEAGGRVLPPVSPENRPPIDVVRNEPLPGQASAPASPKTSYKPPPDMGLPSMTKLSNAPEVNKWMDIAPKEVAYGSNPGQRILDEKLIDKTPELTKAKVDVALEGAGKELGAVLKNGTSKGVRIDAQDSVLDPLNKASKGLRRPAEGAFQKDLAGTLNTIMERYPNLHALNPEEAHALKVELGDAISWEGAGHDDPINQALIKVYRNMNDSIKNSVEGAKDIQDRWGDLYKASKGLKRTIDKRLVGRGPGAQPATAEEYLRSKGAR